MVVQLYWNGPPSSEYPPGLMCKTKAVGFGLSLVLELLLIVYKTSCVKKANKQPSPIANRKQVAIETKEVFVTALNYFSDPVYSAVVSGQLNCNWRQENQELC